MIKLVVFDLGETLINYKGVPLNWSSHYGKALEYAFNCLSIPINSKMIDDASSVLLKYNTRINPRKNEVSAETIFKEIFSVIDVKSEIKNFIDKFFEYFQRETETESTAIDLLNHLKNAGIKSAVLTDVPYGMPKDIVLKDLVGLSSYLDLILTSVETGFRKPVTVGLKLIMNQFGVDESETIYVGNEQKDIELANATGAISVLIKTGGEKPEWGQKHTISKLHEIILLLDNGIL